MKFYDIHSKEWREGNYDCVLGEDGNLYQYYSFKNEVTGEEVFQVAKYLFDGNYISKEDAEHIIGKGRISAQERQYSKKTLKIIKQIKYET